MKSFPALRSYGFHTLVVLTRILIYSETVSDTREFDSFTLVNRVGYSRSRNHHSQEVSSGQQHRHRFECKCVFAFFPPSAPPRSWTRAVAVPPVSARGSLPAFTLSSREGGECRFRARPGAGSRPGHEPARGFDQQSQFTAGQEPARVTHRKPAHGLKYTRKTTSKSGNSYLMYATFRDENITRTCTITQQ